MIAMFTGRNNSMGLTKGRFYNIVAIPNGKFPIVIKIDNTYTCPYSSLETFSANWQLMGS